MNPSFSKDGDHIKVVVRSRPLNDAEVLAKTPSLVTCDVENRQVNVAMHVGSKRSNKGYTFDQVFGPYASQGDIYESSIRPIVEEVLLGFNCTVFAYGQTGTGKTHTMEGKIDDPDLMGVIPRAVKSIFQALNAKSSTDAEYSVKVSFLELYNEELQDLLSDTDEKRLRVVEDKSKINRGVVCHNLEEVVVKSEADILSIMKQAMAKRHIGETQLNRASSRSHCIFTLTVHIKETTPEGEDLLKVGKLNLVDLAGSECIGRSGAKHARAREAGNINQSLLTLGRVIQALVEKSRHVPYRDSKLTRLLQESLGGRAKTCIIATVAPSVQCIDETISTLDYAARAKTIKNRPEVNQRMTKRQLIKEYDVEMDRLRSELAATRSKNGVYLPEERYNELVQQVSGQTAQLTELEAVLEQRASELKEVRDLFNTTSSELVDTKVKLQGTTESLTATKADLSRTEEELQAEQVAKAKVTEIMHAHATTEVKLHAKAKAHTENLDATIGDVQKLHQKIDRKLKLEMANIERAGYHGKESSESLKTISAHTKQHCNDQIERTNAVAENIASMHQQGVDTSNKIMSTLSQLDEAVATASATLAESCDTAAGGVQQAVEDLGVSNQEFMESSKRAAFESFANVAESIERVKSIVDQQKQENEAWSKQIQAQLVASSELVNSFAASQSNVIDALVKSVAELVEGQATAMEAQQKKIDSFVNLETKRSDNATDNLLKTIAGALQDYQNNNLSALTKHADEFKSANLEAGQALDGAHDTVNAHVVQCRQGQVAWQAEQSAMSAAFEGLVNTHHDHVAESSRNGQDQLDLSSSAIDTARSTMSSNLDGQLENQTINLAAASDSLKSVVDVLSDTVANQLGTCADQVKSCSEDMATLVETAERVHQAQTSHRAAVESADADFRTEHDSRVKELHTDLTEFQEKHIKPDVPTGATPVKKMYNVDRDIPMTSPHSRIIEKFETQGPSHELPIKYLPKSEESLRLFAVKEESPAEETYQETSSEDNLEDRDATDGSACNEPVEPAADAQESEVPETNVDPLDDQDNEAASAAKNAAPANNFLENLMKTASAAPPQKPHPLKEISVSEMQNTAAPAPEVQEKPHLTKPKKLSMNSDSGNSCSSLEENENQPILTEAAVLKMKVTQLRKALAERGCSQVGNKAALQERLLNEL